MYWRRMGRLISCLLLILGCTGCVLADSEKQGEIPHKKQKMTLMCISTVDQEILSDAVKEFNDTNRYQVELECEYLGVEEYKEQIARRMAVNEEPDIFFSWQSGFLEAFVDRGKVQALDSWIEREEFQKESFQNVTFHNKIYAVPMTECVTVVYYKKAMFQKYGLTVPNTFEDFLNLCAVLKENGEIPLSMSDIPWNAGQLFLELLNGICGRELVQYETLSRIPWTSEPFCEAARLLQSLYRLGYVPEDFLGTEGEAVRAQDCAMQVSGSWFSGWMGEEYGAFLLPPVREENRGISVGGADRSFAVSDKCKNPEAACSFLALYASEKYQSRVLYEEGSFPVTGIEADENRINPLQQECLDLMEETEEYCLYMDVRFGMEFGDLFNESAQAILAGEDWKEILGNLEKYAQEEK